MYVDRQDPPPSVAPLWTAHEKLSGALAAVICPGPECPTTGVQVAQGVVGQERWGVACVDDGYCQGWGLVVKYDEHEGGFEEAWRWKILGRSCLRGHFEGRIPGVEQSWRNGHKNK